MNDFPVRQSMISGIVWMTAAKGVAQAISWLITIVVVRLLTPQDYGLMGMAVLFNAFVFLFNEIGLGAAIIRKADLRSEHLSNLRWIICSINVFLFAGVNLCAPLVAAYFKEPRVADIVRVLSVTFIMNAAGAPSGYLLQRRMAFREKATAELVGGITGAVTTLAVAASGFGVWSLVSGTLVQQFTINTLYCVHAPLRMRWRFSTNGLGEFFNFGSQVAASRFLWWVASNADFMVVGRVLGPVQLGYYSLAFQFSSVPIDKLVAIVNQVAFPSFSAVQHDDEATKRRYLKLVATVALLTFPMFIGLLLVADTAVDLFFTAKWTPAVTPLKILCVVSCLRAVEILNTPLVVARGQPGIVLGNSFLQATVLPAAVYLGAQNGILGVAIAWLLTRPLFFAVITTRALRVVGLTYSQYFYALRHSVIGCLLMAATVIPVQRYALVGVPKVSHLAITCGLGCVVYLSYNVWFNGAALREGLEVVRRRRPRRTSAAPTPVAAQPDSPVAFSQQ